MTIDDINKIAGYIPETSTMEKYAYFLDSDITYDTAVLEYDGYTKTKHTSEFFTRFNSNWTTPRFYTWDYADSENITEDENGISYAYPTEGKPVYVTKTSSRYDINSYKHVNDNSITVSSLLGSNSFWLASLGVVTEPSIALFTVRMVDYDVTSRLLATSYGATFEHSEGVRPLVSLGFDIQAKGKGTLSSPFKLSLISEQN